ncbi:MAG: hypothetical protein ACKVOU_15125 [Cytophagales bacterium]
MKKKLTFGTLEDQSNSMISVHKSLDYTQRFKLCIESTERNHWRNEIDWRNGINKSKVIRVFVAENGESLEDVFKIAEN